MPDPDPFPWLPLTKVLTRMRKVEADPMASVIDDCRKAACEWVESRRKDLLVTVNGVTTFQATWRVKEAAQLATARLVARIDSPNGVVAFAELGAGSILSNDPDVKRMVGHPPLAVG